MLRPLMLRAGLAGLMLAFFAAAAFAASGDRKDIVLRGVVSDGAGKPVASASVSATGPLEFSTIANATGHYLLTIHVGTVGALVRQPMTFVIEAKDGGARVPVAGGPAKLELKVMALADSLGQPHVAVRSNFAALDLQLNAKLGLPGDGDVGAMLDFSRHKGGAAQATAAPAATTATTQALPPAASKSESKASAPAKSGSKSVLPGPASAAPAAAAPQASVPAVIAAPSARKAKRKKDDVTAMDLLEASKRTGTVLGVDRGLDSLLGAQFPSGAPTIAGGDGARRMKSTLDSLSRAAKQEAKRRHSFTRDSVRAAQRASANAGKHGFQRDAAAAGAATGAAAGSQSSAKFAGPSAEEQARRDSARIAQRAKESDRESMHRLALEHQSMRHDSTLAALRMRDSLRAVAHAEEEVRAAQRRDSLKAAKSAAPTLDPRPPVAGRVAGDPPDPDTCRCRIRGTIEARTDRPLPAPLQVTISVRGVAGLASHVRLDMGSPREFTFERVPCGQRVLDVAIEGGRRFTLLTPDELKADCAAGRLIQPRIAIKPN